MKFSINFLTVGVLSLFFLVSIGFVAAAESSPTSTSNIHLDADPGILPDSPFYFIDQLLEFNADDPENALAYKQEKIAEALVMAEEKKTAEARKALQGASGYGNTLEKEITPEMEKSILKDSAAAKNALATIAQEIPELEEDAIKLIEKEDRIKLAAQVSSKIKKLCETLAKLDSKQYAENCKVAEDSPQWQKDLDEELTGEQKQQAQTFVGKLRQCAETNGQECDCEGMGIQSFEKLCKVESAKAVRCQSGDQQACQSQASMEDLFNAVPVYLHPFLKGMMQEFAGQQEAGQFSGRGEVVYYDGTPESEANFLKMCLKYEDEERCQQKIEIMRSGQVIQRDQSSLSKVFQYDGSQESEEKFLASCRQYEKEEDCQQRLSVMRSGENSDTVEFGPGPCRDAGLTSVSECTQYMDSNFEKIGPGEWRSTSYSSSPVGFEADCTAITDLAAKAKCFEDFYVKAQSSFSPDFLAAQPQYDPKNGVPSNSDQASAYFNEFNWVNELAWNVVGASTDKEREKARQQLQEEGGRRGVSLTITDDYPGTFVVKWKDTSGQDFQSEYSYSAANSKEYSNEPVTYPSENTVVQPSPQFPASNSEEEYKKYLEEYQRKQQQEVSPEPIPENLSAGSENTAKQPSAPVESTPVENTTVPPVESGDASVLVPEQPATDNTEVSSDQQLGDGLPEDSNNHGETSITGSAVREYDSGLSPVTVWILKFLGISSG